MRFRFYVCTIALIAAMLVSSSLGFAQSTSPLNVFSELDVKSLGIVPSAEKLDDPFQVWVKSGSAYVADYSASVIRKVILSNGIASTLAGKAGEFGAVDGNARVATFGQPAGIWTDSVYAYVTDAYFDTIRRVSLVTGYVTTLAGSATNPSGSQDGVGSAARFRSPHGLWGDSTNLYVCDTLNFTLRKIDVATGQVTTLAGVAGARGTIDGIGSAARFYAPMDIWGDGTDLYIADGNAIRKVNIATGKVQTISGSATDASFVDSSRGLDARFSFITGLWGFGEILFVADSGNNVLRKVTLETGAVTTIAGTAQEAGNVDGRGLAVRFDNPTDIAGDGNALYVSDRMNSDIRVGTPVAPPPPPPPPPTPTPSSPAPSNPSPSAPGPSSPAPSSSGPPTPPAPPAPGPSSPNPTRSGPILPQLTDDVPGTQVPFQFSNVGGTSQVTFGENELIQNGYARLVPDTGSAAPTGMAIFSSKSNGVLVSEASVPVSKLMYDGRIPAQIDGAVNTGVALANPNMEDAQVSFYFADGEGTKLYAGYTTVPKRGLIAGFLSEPPFFAPLAELNVSLATARTFTLSSSLPIGITAIRGLTNERSEFLVTTLPVLEVGVADTAPVVFPHYVDGGGWSSKVVLVNRTDTTVGGLVDVFGDDSRQTVPYSIPPRGTKTIQTSGDSAGVRTGWIKVTPTPGMLSPAGTLILSLQVNGVTITEAGVSGMPESSASRVFVETSGNFSQGEPGSMQSGIALSNSDEIDVPAVLELFALDGTPTGVRSFVMVPAKGKVARFLNELPGFTNVPASFRGFLRISGPPLGIVGLRGRYNERTELLITTTLPAAEPAQPVPTSSEEAIIPYLADGGGFSTQFVLYNDGAHNSSSGKMAFMNSGGKSLALPLK